jgi:ubiquinone/menaquinone biosynthesis C-methylase UbiE
MRTDGGQAPGAMRTIEPQLWPARRGAASPRPSDFVPESRFGVWFLDTFMWSDYVLKLAVEDLQRLMPDPTARRRVVLDIGCGHGRSLPLLMAAFRPDRLIGLDRDHEVLATAQANAAKIGPAVKLLQGDCVDLPLPDASVDLVFCHQTFHHLVDQEGTLREIDRVLQPSGLLLFAESTRAYIESWIIRLLFRHPMHVQRSADEYVAMVRAAGFRVPPDAVSYPYLWWSRPDLGARQLLLRTAPPPRGAREETMVNLIAQKPA